MIKYINRDALVHTLMDKGFYPIIVRNAIEATTVTDVAPVIHARWELCYEDYRQQIAGDKCSACGFEHYGCSISHYHYCPNYGAKMEEDEYKNEKRKDC